MSQFKSAETGEFVTEEEAEANPATTYEVISYAEVKSLRKRLEEAERLLREQNEMMSELRAGK